MAADGYGETNPQCWIQFQPSGRQSNKRTLDIDEAGNAMFRSMLGEGYNAVELREELQDSEGNFCWLTVGKDSIRTLRSTYLPLMPLGSLRSKSNLRRAIAQYQRSPLVISSASAQTWRLPLGESLQTGGRYIDQSLSIRCRILLIFYIVEELPVRRITLPDDGGKFDFLISENSSKVQVIYKVELRQLKFQRNVRQ